MRPSRSSYAGTQPSGPPYAAPAPFPYPYPYPRSPPVHRPSPSEAEALLADELADVRPDLTLPYTDALPGARAAVLTRLWRALAYEPLPWIARRAPGRDGLTLHLTDGRRLHGPHADPYATTAYVTEIRLDDRPYDRPARLMTALALPHGPDFAAELDHSVASLALSRANQPADAADAVDAVDAVAPVTSWEWEQRVVDGHPFHPNCRSRPGFSAAEQLAYGPEHRPVVRLVPVEADECLVVGAWPERFRAGQRVLIPVHPWQADHVLKCPSPDGTDRRDGADGTDGADGIPAHPLMSLRTLALPDGGPHVKTALSTRLTSSVRDISVYSIETAAAVSAFAEQIATRTDGLLHITRTLGAVTAGSPDLAAVLRESPETYAAADAGERVVPVAALTSTALTSTGLPHSPSWQSSSWLADFTRLTLTVCLRLLDLGVALEAHGQNLLVVLSATGAPLRLVYRDLADIRVSPARLARHGIPAPDFAGRIVTDDETILRRKLFGSLVTGALGATAGSAPALREALCDVVRDLPRTPDLAGAAGGAGTHEGADLDAAVARAGGGQLGGGAKSAPVKAGATPLKAGATPRRSHLPQLLQLLGGRAVPQYLDAPLPHRVPQAQLAPAHRRTGRRVEGEPEVRFPRGGPVPVHRPLLRAGPQVELPLLQPRFDEPGAYAFFVQHPRQRQCEPVRPYGVGGPPLAQQGRAPLTQRPQHGQSTPVRGR